jgi:hypothetical protein
MPNNTIILNPFSLSLSLNFFTTINTPSRDIFKRSKYERLKGNCRSDEQLLVMVWQEGLHSVIGNFLTLSGRFILNFWQYVCVGGVRIYGKNRHPYLLINLRVKNILIIKMCVTFHSSFCKLVDT